MSTLLNVRFVTPTDIGRIVLGWGAFLVLILMGGALKPPVPSGLLFVTLGAIVAVIVVCAFGVVKQAEALAHRLGDPYGSLVLTLSIVLIEVILIAAVMLGTGEHLTIARDSVMAVSMIIMNLVIGLSLLFGAMRHNGMQHNRTGTSAYLSMLIVLSAFTFGLPALIGESGSYKTGQSVAVMVLTILVYVFFLFRQMGAQADDFREVDQVITGQQTSEQIQEGALEVVRRHRREIVTRLALLIVTVLPIVLLSHDMASLLDAGLQRVGAPVSLVGVLIAIIVFLPESITSVRAALNGEAQRVNNLCHGALVSTVGLTIPAVLLIGMATGQRVVLAESPANMLLLAVTLLLSIATFSARKTTAINGAAHLVVFFAYGMVLLS